MCNTAQTMIDWSDLRYVLETVRHSGLSGAARALGVNHATVARRIQAAEQASGAVLFDRLPGGYAPTAAGLEAARAAEAMEAANAALSLSITARDERLSGPLSVTAPQLLIERVLGGILAEFCAAHPEIELQLFASNEALNLSQREADVAIRVSDAPLDTLVGSRVADQRAAVYVSRAYGERLGTTPGQRLDWIRFSHWPGVPAELNTAWPERRVALVLDDMAAAIGAVRAGIGATRMPCFLGETDPQLVRLPGVPLFAYPSIWVLTHRDLQRVRRIETFVEFASARLRRLRPVFVGDPKG
ncbi:LysR family transcriptional regulator [Hoeflea phototrophica]|nr:LysR family transcriptional regulator [Hoeflea phototrophica]